MALYVGTPKQRWRQWKVLHIRPRWNRLRRKHDTVVIEHRSDARVHYSDFPHPLVTFDYSKDGQLIGVTVCGSDMKVKRY
jgi:hypothetical protein